MADERAREGVAHLQAAFLELIEAARAFLDVAEEVVRDPDLLGRAAHLADVLRRPPGGGPKSHGPDAEGGDERVRRIRVD